MPLSHEQLDQELGHFEYRALPGGKLDIEKSWIEAKLTYIDLPWPLVLGWGGKAARIRCHQRVASQLEAALQEIYDRKLTHLIRTYDGAWNPRLVRGGNTPSHHSWGIALDLNKADFPLGSPKQQDRQLVEIMARHGFECGQVWQGRKDPMHFEAIRFDVGGAAPAPPGPGDAVAVFVGGTQVATGRLQEGHVVAPVAVVLKALGKDPKWDPAQRRLTVE